MKDASVPPPLITCNLGALGFRGGGAEGGSGLAKTSAGRGRGMGLYPVVAVAESGPGRPPVEADLLRRCDVPSVPWFESSVLVAAGSESPCPLSERFVNRFLGATMGALPVDGPFAPAVDDVALRLGRSKTVGAGAFAAGGMVGPGPDLVCIRTCRSYFAIGIDFRSVLVLWLIVNLLPQR